MATDCASDESVQCMSEFGMDIKIWPPRHLFGLAIAPSPSVCLNSNSELQNRKALPKSVSLVVHSPIEAHTAE